MNSTQEKLHNFVRVFVPQVGLWVETLSRLIASGRYEEAASLTDTDKEGIDELKSVLADYPEKIAAMNESIFKLYHLSLEIDDLPFSFQVRNGEISKEELVAEGCRIYGRIDSSGHNDFDVVVDLQTENGTWSDLTLRFCFIDLKSANLKPYYMSVEVM